MSPPETVLALNGGSSSLKFALFRCRPRLTPLFRGEADSIGRAASRFKAWDASGTLVADAPSPANQVEAVRQMADLLCRSGTPPPQAIGHRIVHGGPHLASHVRVDDEVLRLLDAAAALAPLHVPSALKVLQITRKTFPDCVQIACLDNAFHADLPEVARYFPLPLELAARGIRRYGFHGLSCESILRRLGSPLPSRIIVAHLGGGCSVTAIRDGRSVDTSMGLTPSGGMMMTTRSGDLDPGLLLYLQTEGGHDQNTLAKLTEQQAGLAGVSGLSGDVRDLRPIADGNHAARLALDMFCYSARKHIAAAAAALEGIDLLIFTGGIGECDADTRRQICAGLEWLTGPRLPTDAIRVMAAEEEEQIAIHTRRVAG